MMTQPSLRKILSDYLDNSDEKCCLLSIKPKYVERIISHEKKFEYRKKCFSNDVTKVFIYSSSPVKRIIGYFHVSNIFNDTPRHIWNTTSQFGGINKDDFDSYSENHSSVYAIAISDLRIFSEVINPYNHIEKFIPPQSYYYI